MSQTANRSHRDLHRCRRRERRSPRHGRSRHDRRQHAAMTEEKAGEYAHDIEVLAKGGYLKYVDVTLFSNGVEVRAARYNVNTEAGDLTSSRPGGVLWPRVSGPICGSFSATPMTIPARRRRRIRAS